MGFRFRRSFRVFPGLKVNVSKSGVSYTEQHRGGGGEVGWILLLLVVVAVLAFVFAA